jgi:pimeloyl-ACP methyl ester carboxylesterase
MGMENAATGQERSEPRTTRHDLARTMKLPDGRTLGYAEYGPEDAPPLFLFHGLPGSRLAMEELWPDGGPGDVRVIAPDRPGIGLSDPQPGRRIGDWAADVAALADALGISRFAVAGYSGGGPHALAVAHVLPDRVVAAGCIASGGRFDDPQSLVGLNRTNRLLRRLSRSAPALLKVVASGNARSTLKDPAKAYDLAAKDPGLASADREAMAQARPRELFIAHAAEAFRQGSSGVVQEIRLCFGPWDFDIAQIKVPVHVWHGEDDTYVPVAMARRIAEQIPGAALTVYPKEGHLFSTGHWEEIRETLIADLR